MSVDQIGGSGMDMTHSKDHHWMWLISRKTQKQTQRLRSLTSLHAQVRLLKQWCLMEIVKGMYIGFSQDIITTCPKAFPWCLQYLEQSVFAWHCALDTSQILENAMGNTQVTGGGQFLFCSEKVKECMICHNILAGWCTILLLCTMWCTSALDRAWSLINVHYGGATLPSIMRAPYCPLCIMVVHLCSRLCMVPCHYALQWCNSALHCACPLQPIVHCHHIVKGDP